jgi:glutathione S-transferase
MITIHGVFGSPFVRALRIALDEKGLTWAWAPFPLGAQKQEPYLTLQPFAKIPAVVDDGFALYETNAILRHIDRKAPEPALIPTDPYRAARMDQLMCIVDCTLWPSVCRPINFNRLVAPRIGVPVDDAAVAAAVPIAETTLKAVAALYAGPFLTGDTLTLADIAVLPHIDALAKTQEGREMLPAYPGIEAWLATMRARPSVPTSNLPPEKVLAA